MALKYNPINGNFQIYEAPPIEKVELNMPLFNNPLDISDWASSITPEGNIIVKSEDEGEELHGMISEPTNVVGIGEGKAYQPEVEESNETTKATSPKSQTSVSGRSVLSGLIDEVANEKGFEGLKDPETKELLMLQAARESNFDSKIRSSSSTASGWFQITDDTRKSHSTYSREEFLNDPREQIRAAYKNLKYIWNLSAAKKLLEKGYNKKQITALGWWRPASLQEVLNGNFDHVEGGYSTKRAIADYQDKS